MYEVRWLRGEAVLDRRRQEKLEQAQRDARQLSAYYQRQLGATHVEIWQADGAMLLQMPSLSFGAG